MAGAAGNSNELPNALDRLTLAGSTSTASLSKYFNQEDDSASIFDAIAKPKNDEPTVDLLKSSNAATPIKEDSELSSKTDSFAPSVSFQKRDDVEPKIFSYFSQKPVIGDSTKDVVASEFFDQISEQASKTHEPVEIKSQPPLQSQVDIPLHPESTPSNLQKMPIIGQSQMEANLNFSTLVQPTNSTGYFSSLPAPTGNPVDPAGFTTSLPPQPIFTPKVLNTIHSGDVAELFNPDKTCSQALERAASFWIPSDETRSLLQIQATSPDLLTAEIFKPISPGLSSSTELTDPIQILLCHFDGEAAAANRQTLTADKVTQDDKGIRDLIQAGCWRAGANLCARILTAYGQGYERKQQPIKHTPHSLQLWFTRLALLVKIQQVEMAMAEMVAFGNLDSPDLFYEFYGDLYGANRAGSMVAFSFRLLIAELPSHNHNRISEAEERLCQLLVVVRRVISNLDELLGPNATAQDRGEALRLWQAREVRVIHSLVNCTLRKKDYHNSLQLLCRLLDEGHGPQSALFSMLGRVYLQLGDVVRAQRAFNSAADLRSGKKESIATLMDAALVAIAQNAFAEAFAYYQKALALDPDNALLVNNAAVCLLYMGRMQDSMLMLEEKLGTKPNLMIHNPTVLNVCTLYELESSLTTQRKLGMLRLASQWRSDNLSSNSFKLPT